LIPSIAPDGLQPAAHYKKFLQGEAMMTSVGQTMPAGAAMPGLLDRGRIIATAGFNRWLVPPAALCIHLCIGMAYGFSVFWLPLSRALGQRLPKRQSRW
jgi:hypothetical protein